LADPEHLRWKRENELRRVYGITPEQLAEMIEAQQGRCAICGRGHSGPGTRLHIDHDHVSGRVRALLCSPCNTALGLLGDDLDRVQRLAEYLRSYVGDVVEP